MTACKLSLEPILSYWTYFASVCTVQSMDFWCKQSWLEILFLEKTGVSSKMLFFSSLGITRSLASFRNRAISCFLVTTLWPPPCFKHGVCYGRQDHIEPFLILHWMLTLPFPLPPFWSMLRLIVSSHPKANGCSQQICADHYCQCFHYCFYRHNLFSLINH